MSGRHTKARRSESFRAHADGYYTRVPGWVGISATVTLGPLAWTRFCELIGADEEGNALPEAEMAQP